MLSASSARIVEATLPAVGGALDEITERFYRSMFTAHPELLRDLFNRGNQAAGTQRQALAGSIAAFAGALLNGHDTEALLARISHKHASLGISADQYELVHTHLFGAIADVLGDAVTAEVAAAWSQVYWLMADRLITTERDLTEASGHGLREHRVVARVQETGDVVTFITAPLDGAPLTRHLPGQYVSVGVRLTDGARQIRQYSVSGSTDGAVQFSVKRDGEVSQHLHDLTAVGDTVQVSAPFGDVALAEGDTPVLLASAGIGCTPIISMLAHLAGTGSTRRVIALHADRDQFSHAFRAQHEQLTGRLRNAESHVFYQQPVGPWPTEYTGFADLAGIEIPAGVTAYLCGPLPFLRSVRAQLRAAGVPAESIQYEVFGPDLWLARAV